MYSPSTLAHRLMEVLPIIVHRLRAQARIAVKGKITLPQFRILANIQMGHATISQIAEIQAVAQPTMSKMVDGLVKRGLVKRIADSKDRRQINLRLTTKGRALLSNGKKWIQAQLSRDLVLVEPKERKALATALDQLEKVFLSVKSSQKKSS